MKTTKMWQEENRTNSGSANCELRVGDVHTGFISNVVAYGVFVQFGKSSGLCHDSSIPLALDRTQLTKGRRVKTAIREIRQDRKISLSLLEILPIDESGSSPARKVRSHQAVGALVGDSLNYSTKIGNALKMGASDINKVGTKYKNNPPASRAGFVFEADHQATFNADAAFQRSDVQAKHLQSLKKNSPDIALLDEKGVVAKEIGAKVYKTAEKAVQAHRGYGSQDRLSPKDQVADIKSIASRRAASEQVKPGTHRKLVATEFDEVAQHSTDHMEYKNVKSTARTRAESREMAEKASKGGVTGQDIVGRVGERIQQGAKEGGVIGVTVGTGISAVTSTYHAVKDVRSGKKTVPEASRDVAIEVGKGAADGGIKGMASGAATAGARVLAERVASQGLKRVLGGAGPAALAITGVEIAKHAIDFARGIKTAEAFGDATKSSAKAGAASFVGAEIGFCIGGPVGAIVGGIAGPMIVDQAEKAGLGVRLDRLFSVNTAAGHGGATAFHLAQLQGVLEALRTSCAVVFPDRVIQSSTGHHASAEIVMVHQGKVYAVDFKAWIGSLSYQEIVETRIYVEKGWIWDTTKEIKVPTGEFNTKFLEQVKRDQYGYTHLKTHRNPLLNLRNFVYRMKDRLVAADPRWKRIQVETIAVFPDDSVKFTGDMVSDGRFMVFKDFIKLLADGKGDLTPDWMLDGLSLIPTWDALQDPTGNLYQGLIQTSHFTLQLKDGSVIIPFDAVLKIDVVHGGALSRADKVTVTLRDRNTLEGTVEKQEIVLQRKGHSHTYLLQDLSLVCPAFSLLSA